jgi:Co/Zn/Cd efflux system component
VAGTDSAILDLHVWRLGPSGHAAILSLPAPVDCEALRARLYTIPGLRHVTVEVRNP